MAYKYDVFLSYNLKYPHGDWVNNIFLPFFKPLLEDALNIHSVSIFQDTSGILTGQDWENRILDALLHSRIMVSIFTPAYFNSEWCKKEFAIMDYRQRELGYMSLQNSNGIIVPLKISDGEHFPEIAKELQIADFNNYHRIGPGFPYTPLYIEMQGKLQSWINDVAYAHKNAPDWNAEWLDRKWVEQSFLNLDKLDSGQSLTPPTL